MTPEERMDVARCKNKIQQGHIKYIQETGLSILHVMEGQDPDTPEWSYTIGLWHSYGHPEILVVGLRPSLTQILLNNLRFSIASEGRSFGDGTIATDVIDGYVCHFKTIPAAKYDDFFTGDEWFYGNADFPAVQMLWPNTSGVYPWDVAADDYLRWVQPILTQLPARPS